MFYDVRRISANRWDRIHNRELGTLEQRRNVINIKQYIEGGKIPSSALQHIVRDAGAGLSFAPGEME